MIIGLGLTFKLRGGDIMRRRVRGSYYGKLLNVPWKRAYYWVGYNSKTNTINSRLRKWRNKGRTY